MRNLFTIILLLGVLFSEGLFAQNLRKYQMPEGIQSGDFSNNQIIVRLMSQRTNARLNTEQIRDIDALVKMTGTTGFESIIKSVPGATTRQRNHPLTYIYKVSLRDGQDPIQVINNFLKYPEVVYAEPYFLHKPMFVPNDPDSKTNRVQGPYLSLIKAYDAWNLTRGDSSIFVAVLDTGTKLNHEDLEDNLWINYSDPINGLDDDDDGLVDNYFGYDFANEDNDATADQDGHGVGVAGISSATTNNGIGIAGIGFNCRYMPLKIFNSLDNTFANGYEAIIFAADKGAKVINLSWGSEDSYSQFGQDAVNYAVLEKDAVVVAAGGNTDAELDFYPASFENVLSIGATNNDDEKASWATYSYKIDLMAPGQEIYTTTSDGEYGSDQGTSYSSPLVAGAAALLRTYKPNLSARQVMEKLRITSDDIYDIAANQSFIGQLGHGRLNILKALTDNISPSVRFENITYDNKNGSLAYFKDTLIIGGDFVNYLEPTPNLKVTLSCESPYITIIEPLFLAGNMGTLDTISMENNFFRVILSEDIPPETRLVFRLDYKDGFYEDFQYFEIITTSDYATISNGSLAMTIAGNGGLGYYTDGYSEGLGFTFDDEKLAEHLGLIISREDPDSLSNNAVIVFEENLRDHDFVSTENIRFYNNTIALQEVRSSFIEIDTLPNTTEVSVDQILITADTTRGDFMILEYRVINQSASFIDTLHTSLFADWDLGDPGLNIAGWSEEDSLGYIYYPNTDSLYAAIALITRQIPIHSASTRSILGDTLDRMEKFINISEGIINQGAGSIASPENVSHFIGGSFIDLQQNVPNKIAFAITADHSFEAIKANIDSARSFYSEYKANPPLGYIAYTCEGDSALIDPPGTLYDFYEDINQETLIFSGESFKTPPVTEPQIFYAVNKDQPYESELILMKALVKSANIDFSFSPDTVYLDESHNNHVQFIDQSISSVLWEWDFDNGFASTISDPTTSYFSEGNYEVSLYVENDIGCSDSLIKNIRVLERSPKPELSPVSICKGESVTIDPSNATSIRVYADEKLSNQLFEGETFISGPIDSDTLFYVTNYDAVESLSSMISVNTSRLEADFTYSVDTLNTLVKYLLKLENQSESEGQIEWRINDQFYGHSQDTTFNYTGLEEFSISIIASDTLGCMEETNRTLIPMPSPPPMVTIPEPICKGESVILSPSEAGTYFFYSDQSLDSLIKKGRALQINNLQQSQNVYILTMDSLFDSDTLEVPIMVSSLNADFTIDPDSLNLTESSTVQFQSLSSEAISWLWDFDNGQTDSIPSPFVTFDDPGQYSIYLRTKDSINCVASKEQPLQVVSILSIQTSNTNSFKIYPNPSSDEIFIRFQDSLISGPATFTLYNNKGSVLWQNNRTIENNQSLLNLPKLTSGLYYLKVNIQDHVSTEKLIIK